MARLFCVYCGAWKPCDLHPHGYPFVIQMGNGTALIQLLAWDHRKALAHIRHLEEHGGFEVLATARLH